MDPLLEQHRVRELLDQGRAEQVRSAARAREAYRRHVALAAVQLAARHTVPDHLRPRDWAAPYVAARAERQRALQREAQMCNECNDCGSLWGDVHTIRCFHCGSSDIRTWLDRGVIGQVNHRAGVPNLASQPTHSSVRAQESDS